MKLQASEPTHTHTHTGHGYGRGCWAAAGNKAEKGRFVQADRLTACSPEDVEGSGRGLLPQAGPRPHTGGPADGSGVRQEAGPLCRR